MEKEENDFSGDWKPEIPVHDIEDEFNWLDRLDSVGQFKRSCGVKKCPKTGCFLFSKHYNVCRLNVNYEKAVSAKRRAESLKKMLKL